MTKPPQTSVPRYDTQQALELLSRMPLGELMGLAHAARMKRCPKAQVTYVVDTNPNYTNICQTGCLFCAFCRRPDDPEAYTLTPQEVADSVAKAHALGATTVLIQGGHNPRITLKDWIDYIRAIRQTCPQIHIHPFSPAEYHSMAALEKRPVKEILAAIRAEGIDTIPGGGAEILTETVRRRIAPGKAGAKEWLETCETAHKMGFKTTATMMFGHVETHADIITHLMRLRDLQDQTGGFSSFVPWSFKPGTTPLAKSVPKPAHPALYVRIIATARLVLDNFAHIQSSWFSESIRAGQMGLLAGADDFGGVLIEENVLRQTGHDPRATIREVKNIIRRAGFEPVQRDSYYNAITTVGQT